MSATVSCASSSWKKVSLTSMWKYRKRIQVCKFMDLWIAFIVFTSNWSLSDPSSFRQLMLLPIYLDQDIYASASAASAAEKRRGHLSTGKTCSWKDGKLHHPDLCKVFSPFGIIHRCPTPPSTEHSSGLGDSARAPKKLRVSNPFFLYILELLSIFFLDTFIYEDSWKTQKPSSRILHKRILFNIWILWTPSEAHGPMLVLEQTLPRHCVWVTPQWTL